MSQTSLTPARPAIPKIKPLDSKIDKQGDREVELKFLVSDSGFKASQQWPVLGLNGRRPPAKRLRTVYFDTAQGDLRRHKMVLRMRSARRGYVMALKYNGGFPGGMFERGEIEVATLHDMPDLTLFGPEASSMIADAIEGKSLGPVYATDIRRMTHRIQTETSDIEIAFDSGVIVAGDVSEPVREIELELKAGDVTDLYRLGILLAEQFPVRLGSQAKSDRGAMLAAAQKPKSARALPTLAGEVTVDEAIGRAINGCIAQFIGNWPAFDKGDGVGAVHQMRVAMRRLRAMLGLFDRSFPCPEFASLREDAKHIASLMGEARNLDVFIALVRQGPMAAFPNEAGFATILNECEERRVVAYAAIGDMLSAASTTKFVLSAQSFIARYGWRNALPAEALPRLVLPAQEFAATQLTRLHHRVLKRGKHLATLSAHDRHEVRIDLKKLRYAADLFAPLFENRGQIKSYLNHATALQEQLGLFNDLAVAIDTVSQLDSADNRAAGMILGWCSRGSIADNDELKEAWREFRNAKLFWA